jgi:hypothetical protein
LVRDHEYEIAGIVGSLYRCMCAIDPLQLAGFEDLAAVLVQHAVPIKENCRSVHVTALARGVPSCQGASARKDAGERFQI